VGSYESRLFSSQSKRCKNSHPGNSLSIPTRSRDSFVLPRTSPQSCYTISSMKLLSATALLASSHFAQGATLFWADNFEGEWEQRWNVRGGFAPELRRPVPDPLGEHADDVLEVSYPSGSYVPSGPVAGGAEVLLSLSLSRTAPALGPSLSLSTPPPPPPLICLLPALTVQVQGRPHRPYRAGSRVPQI
jgi:hypothetical protein